MEEESSREKLGRLSERENWRDRRKLAAALLLLSVAVFVGAVALRQTPVDTVPGLDTGEGPSEGLTKYQQAYVDCPRRYLPLCTKMSKIPTEPVSFMRTENGRLYLDLTRSNRTLVARIQEGGDDGYLVSIEE